MRFCRNCSIHIVFIECHVQHAARYCAIHIVYKYLLSTYKEKIFIFILIYELSAYKPTIQSAIFIIQLPKYFYSNLSFMTLFFCAFSHSTKVPKHFLQFSLMSFIALKRQLLLVQVPAPKKKRNANPLACIMLIFIFF